ncbi:hypothetical protein VTH06DRAFT_8351 [Thermothelomyces fergusii]
MPPVREQLEQPQPANSGLDAAQDTLKDEASFCGGCYSLLVFGKASPEENDIKGPLRTKGLLVSKKGLVALGRPL